MKRSAQALRHPTLEPGQGEPLDAAELSDRAKLGVVLQAAGLLSLLEIAGWKLVEGWRPAKVDADGKVSGLTASPGGPSSPTAPALLALLRSLFGGRDEILGRGEARRAAREVAARWAAVLDRVSADRAVADLLRAAPFLERHEPALDALSGALVRDGKEVAWTAGRSGRALPSELDARDCLKRGRWTFAARAFALDPPSGVAGRIEFARALFGAGRAEAALAVLAGRSDAASETLRAECQLMLGELGGARETVRRLEGLALGLRQRLEASDVALRVLANVGEPDAAREWIESLVARSRGRARLRALLLAAAAAGDRGDVEGMERRLERAAATADDAELAPRWHEAQAQLALMRSEGAAASRHARARLSLERRRMRKADAGRAWNDLGLGHSIEGRFEAAERAFSHAARLLRACDGPLAVTLAATNLADVRLRTGKLAGVEPILEAAKSWNRRSGNLRGSFEDELLWIRWELVRGEIERAVERCRRLREEQERADLDWAAERAAVLEARALGWLDRPGEARAALARCDDSALRELEPEERPFLFALAGETDRAAALARDSDLAELIAPLVRGEEPPRTAWSRLSRLGGFRRARLIFDAETVSPSSTPPELREIAAGFLGRLGATALVMRLRRSRSVAWRALADYCAKPADDREAIEELLAAVGHPEAELFARSGGEERLLAGRGGRRPAAERSSPFGAGELVLRAEEFDEPLRALFALFLREMPAPALEAGNEGAATLLGESPALLAAVARIRRFAASDLPVLILGENGTGKELAAREVHRSSARSNGPNVVVNCAGLAEPLLLAELFGHARGAYTGADRERAGLFETARLGSIFLDEIGDFPASAQGSLLRVLQEKEIRRLGEALPRRVDVRVVAATNRDLEAMVEEGDFRRDLFFRLKAATVVLPPLRERGRDVLLLAETFLARLRRRYPRLRLEPEARRALIAHPWPGNVRELKNVLEAAAALSPDGRIALEHLDLGAVPSLPRGSRPGDYHVELEAFRRRLIVTALEECAGNLAAAARLLGVSRQFLSQYVRKAGIQVR